MGKNVQHFAEVLIRSKASENKMWIYYMYSKRILLD